MLPSVIIVYTEPTYPEPDSNVGSQLETLLIKNVHNLRDCFYTRFPPGYRRNVAARAIAIGRIRY